MWVASYSWWEKRLKMTVCNPFIEKTGNSADQLISRYLWRAIRTQIYEGWGLSVDQQVGYVSRLMSQGVSRQSHEKVPKKVTVMAITLWFDFILIAISFPWILMTGALLTWQSQAAFINEDTENSQRSGYSMWKGQGWESPSALGCDPSILARCHLFFSPWLLTFSIHQICSPWMKNNHPWGCWEGRILCSEVKPKGAPKPHFAESTNNSSSASGWGKASLPSSLTCQSVHTGKTVTWWAGSGRTLVAAFGIANSPAVMAWGSTQDKEQGWHADSRRGCSRLWGWRGLSTGGWDGGRDCYGYGSELGEG